MSFLPTAPEWRFLGACRLSKGRGRLLLQLGDRLVSPAGTSAIVDVLDNRSGKRDNRPYEVQDPDTLDCFLWSVHDLAQWHCWRKVSNLTRADRQALERGESILVK